MSNKSEIENFYFEKKIFDLETLLGIAKSLSSRLDIHDVMETIIYTCMGQFQSESAAIFLPKGIDDSTLTLRSFKGVEEDNPNFTLDLTDENAILEHFYKDPKTIKVKALKKNNKFKNLLEQLKGFNPNLLSPLNHKNKINGLIVLGNKFSKDDYTDDEMVFLTVLSGFAAIAVENARLYEMATQDRMTKLFIHHYFQTKLDEELSFSVKLKHPLSLIMFDIDHFKKFNDTYGHQQGDMVLIEMGRLIKSECKSSYIPSRYGGEEFTIILPGSPFEEAKEFAEKMRKTIEAHDFPGIDRILKVTSSFGVTSFPFKKPIEKSELISRVDHALYLSKDSGRNTVSTYEGNEKKIKALMDKKKKRDKEKKKEKEDN